VYQHNERRNSAHLKERPRRKIKPDKRWFWQVYNSKND
jgi:hypothetical protein